jgi:glycosyltransferase involved in cell wall biosynthesis
VHILMLAPLYTPYIGGAETHTRGLAEALVERGQRVSVLTDCGYRRLPNIETVGGVRVLRTERLGPDGTADDGPGIVRWEAALFDLFAEVERRICTGTADRPDVVHAQCQISFLLGAVLKECLGCPLVVTPHETEPEQDGLGSARSRFLFTLPQIDLFIANSQAFAKQAMTLGRPVAATVVVESAVRPGAVARPIRPALRAATTILSVGRFKPRKNQLALLEAVALLRSRGLAVSCVFAGTCDAGSVEYRDQLVAQARRLGNAVRVVEGADDSELECLMRRADLVVQPATAEGLGLVAIEALHAGTPVLATPTAGAVEVLGDFPSLLTTGFAVTDLAAAIEDALERPAQHAAAAARAAESVRRRFDAQANAGRVLDLYRALVGRTG